MKLNDEIINGLALGADLTKVDPRARKSSTADIVCILLLLGTQSVKVRLDGQRNNGRRVVGKILLEC